MSIILSQQILNDINEQKSNFSDKFKLELITTYHLWFFVKVLWKYYRHSISLLVANHLVTIEILEIYVTNNKIF